MVLRSIAAAAYIIDRHPSMVRRWYRAGRLTAACDVRTRTVLVDVLEATEVAQAMSSQSHPAKVKTTGSAMAEIDRAALEVLATGRIFVDAEEGAVYRIHARWGHKTRAESLDKSTGYGRVFISARYRACPAHRVVWLAVHGPIPPGMYVNHINRRRYDNRISNLELVTHQGNIAHAHGGEYYSVGGSGEHSVSVEDFRRAAAEPRDHTRVVVASEPSLYKARSPMRVR